MKKTNSEMRLSIFNCIIHIESHSQYLSTILSNVYGAMCIEHNNDTPKLTYTVGRSNENADIFFISGNNKEKIQTSDIGEFIFLFEKDMTIELQKIRSDLYFMHAAVVEYQGKAIMIVAPSGTGKSTISWALLHAGFHYLSDELAPVDLSNMEVLPYPHALCLKDIPPVYSLPDMTLTTARTLHVPVNVLPGGLVNKPVPLAAIFFLQRNLKTESSVITQVSKAISSTKIYANTLNALAHPCKGLDAAVSIASQVDCFDLLVSDLENASRDIINTVDYL